MTFYAFGKTGFGFALELASAPEPLKYPLEALVYLLLLYKTTYSSWETYPFLK
jgi:hypothetical protein